MKRFLTPLLVGTAVGVLVGGLVAWTTLFAATPTIKFPNAGPTFVRLEYSHASLSPYVQVEVFLRPGLDRETYGGQLTIDVGDGARRETRHMQVDSHHVLRLAAVLENLRLSRAPYEPTHEWTDDYPRHRLESSTEDGFIRLEMTSQDRAQWMAIVGTRGDGWRLYSVRSEDLGREFEHFRDTLAEPTLSEIKASIADDRRKTQGTAPE